MASQRQDRHPLTITIGSVVLVVVCVLLARWQWTRVNRPVDGYAGEPAAVPLSTLVAPGGPVPLTTVGRQVTVTGTYVQVGQRVVSGHVLGIAHISWVVTPLLTADGRRELIVRGWVGASARGLTQPPTGVVVVTGRVEGGTPLAGGQPGGVNTLSYLVRTAQTPPDPLSLQPVPVAGPRSSSPTEFHLQNAIYVSQWALLALIVVFSWWRLRRAGRGAEAAEGPGRLEGTASTFSP